MVPIDLNPSGVGAEPRGRRATGQLTNGGWQGVAWDVSIA